MCEVRLGNACIELDPYDVTPENLCAQFNLVENRLIRLESTDGRLLLPSEDWTHFQPAPWAGATYFFYGMDKSAVAMKESAQAAQHAAEIVSEEFIENDNKRIKRTVVRITETETKIQETLSAIHATIAERDRSRIEFERKTTNRIHQMDGGSCQNHAFHSNPSPLPSSYQPRAILQAASSEEDEVVNDDDEEYHPPTRHSWIEPLKE